MANAQVTEAVRELLEAEQRSGDLQAFNRGLKQLKTAEGVDDATLRQAVADLIQQQGGSDKMLDGALTCGRCAGSYGCAVQPDGGRCAGSYGCALAADGSLVFNPNGQTCVPAVGPLGLLVLGAGMAAIAALRERAAGRDDAGDGGPTEL